MPDPVEHAGTVKCARRWCRKLLRLNPTFGGGGKQWCSEKHRDADIARRKRG